ncbi:MAG: hypothetical protein KDA68_24620, partial [Planctomycetaceae bacterium]|nr:hypothetical protein [Planctomycetaceae bacterium]
MIINLNALLRSYIGNSITAVPCTVDLDDLLTSNDLDELNIDIDTLLAYRREVAVIWSFEDVIS